MKTRILLPVLLSFMLMTSCVSSTPKTYETPQWNYKQFMRYWCHISPRWGGDLKLTKKKDGRYIITDSAVCEYIETQEIPNKKPGDTDAYVFKCQRISSWNKEEYYTSFKVVRDNRFDRFTLENGECKKDVSDDEKGRYFQKYGNYYCTSTDDVWYEICDYDSEEPENDEYDEHDEYIEKLYTSD